MTTFEHQENLSCMLAGARDVRFENRPVPRIEDPHDVLIRIAYTGVCGSDVHFWQHGGVSTYMIKDPLVMGHEASGIVAAVGSAVTTIKPGDEVALEPGHPCRRCSRCKGGRYHLCPEMRFAASPPTTHGTLTKIFKSPEDYCYRLPKDMSLQEGVLIEPLSVAFHACRLAGTFQPRNAVVVFGAGTVGLLCARVAKALGATQILMLDVLASRLEFATSYVGCSTFEVDATKPAAQMAEKISRLHSSIADCVTTVIDASGAESSMRIGIELLQTGGTFVQVGMGKDEVVYSIMAVCTKELTVKGSFRYGYGDYADAIALVSSGKISVKELITKVVSFLDTVSAWDTTRRGEGVKTLIKVMDD